MQMISLSDAHQLMLTVIKINKSMTFYIKFVSDVEVLYSFLSILFHSSLADYHEIRFI